MTNTNNISFYVAECMEFHSLGEKVINIPTIEKAIEIFKDIPECKHNMGNGVGIAINGDEWSLYENGEIDNLEYYPKEINENLEVSRAIKVLKEII